MADKDKKNKKDRKPKLFKQIAQIYGFTYRDDKQLPFWLAGAFLLPIVVEVIVGLVFHWSVITWVFLTITCVMLGLLLATMTLTRRADAVGFRQLEGRPGAAISVLGNVSKAGFAFPQEPVWIDPKTKDMVWRGTGYNGIYLLGEGDPGRVAKAMDRQERAIKGVTAGSRIPVYRIMVGTGPGQVRLKNVRKAVIKQKSYTPLHHKHAWMDKIHGRTRFVLTKTELAVLNERLRTLQTKNGFGVPKGIDPTHPQKVSRRAMRGR
ncbi:DUF4191 domain-containing protein [Bifidobacterium pullorum subsp. saeculare]|uniref:DUF4191 domain-containing protein n=1 Tax=Bifidobacterium pullorum subsp. saeculare TaxID=78257 RepID=A0A938WWZ8_9BIFI|nr:DUF4191 domain-containing protein [Bifidobacterium pullorum]MBM6699133.1 DUF4191 domain-containing protein [Bifidobacterium pullorum subsp. saeculare]